MASFLTKKEQTLVNLVKRDQSLTDDQRTKMVQSIKDNAELRKHGFRAPVREFIQAMANHHTEKILNQVI